jgi:hypothetical protein
LKRYHDDAVTGGHLGVYKTYHKIQNNHTWPRMRADVCRYVRKCPVCASVKPEQRLPAGKMGSRPEITRPWQMIIADLFGPLPRSTNGHEYVLVIMDYFSKFPIFVPVRSPTARKIIGRSRDFQDFLTNYGVNRTMKSLIISYIEQDQRKWDNNLDRVACALRTARHEDTKQTNKTVKDGTLKENIG